MLNLRIGFIILAIILIPILVFVNILTGNTAFTHGFNEETAETYLTENTNDLTILAEYFTKLEFKNKSVHVDKNGTITTFEHIEGEVKLKKETIEIQDSDVKKAIKNIFNDGFDGIYKDYKNVVKFEIHHTFGEITNGIAFIPNYDDHIAIQYLTSIEPLSEKSWYFFESDYNEWRVNNKLY